MFTTSVPLPGNDVNLDLLERWLSGWSLARGAPLPRRHGGGLVVEVGRADQLRRHVFVDAGAALQDCARSIDAPCIFLKATVDMATLRQALAPRWQIETARYLMRCDGPMAAAPLPAGYREQRTRAHGASVLRLFDASGAVVASGQLVVYGACAVFDQIETAAAHRRRGLGRYLMGALDALACAAGVSERLLVATDPGRALYLPLGWQVLAPYSTAVLAPQLADTIAGAPLRWRQ
ncbi:GNAT family N-acetyltransferase [Massilia sp. PWRC2]|uniref:GNAT family N-acetyltransferase n=1 Tax=Massilia sp. PWRC2 TaxID=2804626 RepID=UPI003CEA1E01